MLFMKNSKANHLSAAALFVPFILMYAIVIPAIVSFMFIASVLGINVTSTSVFGLFDLIPQDLWISIAIVVAKCTFVAGSVLGVFCAVLDTYMIATTSESLVIGRVKSSADSLVNICSISPADYLSNIHKFAACLFTGTDSPCKSH